MCVYWDVWEEMDQNVERNYFQEMEVEGKGFILFTVDDS